jgi:hypothetical protein
MYAAAKTGLLLDLWTRAHSRRAVHTERDDREEMLEEAQEQAESREGGEIPEAPAAAVGGSRR